MIKPGTFDSLTLIASSTTWSTWSCPNSLMDIYNICVYICNVCYICVYIMCIYMSWLQVCLSAEGAKNVSWPWLSPLRGWSSLIMTFTGKFVSMAHHFNLLRLNPFDLRIDRERWWFEHPVSWLQVCLSAEDAKKRFLALVISAPRA